MAQLGTPFEQNVLQSELKSRPTSKQEPDDLNGGQSVVLEDSTRSLFDLGPQALYSVILARDRRFDGQLFVGVSSTRVYCRPICTVRPPRFENCSFHRTAAAAEAAGFRPCLRCRPELAPGTVAPLDAVPRLATLAIRRIEDGALTGSTLDELALELGVSARHLRRAIRLEAGQSPVELAQTQRLLLAKQLLTDTSMTVTQVAYSAGFESLRRFNAAFLQRYRMSPSSLRRSTDARKDCPQDAYVFNVSIRPPFHFEPLLKFWKARATPGVEQVEGNWYRRTVAFGGCCGWVEIGPGRQEHAIQIRISTGLGPVLSVLLPRLKGMLDTRADPVAVRNHLSEDPLLAPLFEDWPGPRIVGALQGFECGVRTILGQQISVQAATTVAGRLAGRFGQPLETPFQELTLAFPTSVVLAAAGITELQSIGLTARRAVTVQTFSHAVATGNLRLEPGVDPARLRESLLAIPGIGSWTAEYLLMRAASWPDAFPSTDLGLLKATGMSPGELQHRAERWRPWRSYAAVLLWNSLATHPKTAGPSD